MGRSRVLTGLYSMSSFTSRNVQTDLHNAGDHSCLVPKLWNKLSDELKALNHPINLTILREKAVY